MLALDQELRVPGRSCRPGGSSVQMANREFTSFTRGRAGRDDPMEVWSLSWRPPRSHCTRRNICHAHVAIGITNQRETTVFGTWHGPAVQTHRWQCRRTADAAIDLRARRVRRRRCEKRAWWSTRTSQDQNPWSPRQYARPQARAGGHVLFGTVDTGSLEPHRRRCTPRLLQRFPYHAFNIHTLDWTTISSALAFLDDAPSVVPSSGVTAPRILVFRSGTAHCRGGWRPAGSSVGQGASSPHGQEHIRHRMLHADEHVGACGEIQAQPAHHDCVGLGARSSTPWKAVCSLEARRFSAPATAQDLDSAVRVRRYARRVPTRRVSSFRLFVGLARLLGCLRSRRHFRHDPRTGREHIVRAALESICYPTRMSWRL